MLVKSRLKKQVTPQSMEYSPPVASGHFAAITEFLLQEDQFPQRQMPFSHEESVPLYVHPAKVFGLNELQQLDCSDFAVHAEDLHSLLFDPLSPADNGSKDYVGYSSTLNQNIDSSNSNGAKHSCDPSVFECSTPKDLLDALFITKQKVQNLETVIQSMAQGGSRHLTPQHHQSLTKSVATITSQLLSATTSFLRHQMPSVLNAHSFVSPHGKVPDERSDSFHDNNIPLSSCRASYEDLTSDIKPAGSMGHVSLGALEMAGQAKRMDLEFKEQIEAYSAVCAKNCLSSTNIGDNVNKNSAIFKHDSAVCNIMAAGSSIYGIEVADGHAKCKTKNHTQTFPEDYDLGNFHREVEDEGEHEVLPPGSYELIEMAPDEILAENTHFCDFCGKGFKRDANLRMHMRGHGDEFKTPAALSKPDKAVDPSIVLKPRRYSCPHKGCKRNKNHQMFQPLKTVLCAKNHYKRSHCPKLLTCYICKTKKFSVVADLKTHQKHCGKDKWQCSCGSTFSRKDKLMSHMGLFAGHRPAVTVQML